MSFRAIGALAGALAAGGALAGTFSMEAKIDREPAIYKVGETAKVRVQIFEDGKPVGGKTAVCSWNYEVSNTVTIAESGSEFELKLDRPGQVLFRADLWDGTNRLKGVTKKQTKPSSLIVWAGALFEPEKLTATRTRPADFDTYWDHEIAEMNRLVPMGKTLPRVAKTKAPQKGFVAYCVEIPCTPRPACATLVLPEKAEAKSLPAVVEFMGYGSSKSSRTCITNAMYMCVNPHGFADDRSNEDWQRFMHAEGEFGYPYDGWESRETCFFHGQILRAVRALQWIKTRPEWNGRDLAVTGVSMGGSQSLQAAALDRDVTMCVPRDPAMCDHAGLIADPPHRPGWPWILATPRKLPEVQGYGPVDPALLAISDYFDNVFFAERITCPVYLATGLADDVCFSEGVLKAFNATKGPKYLETDPYNGHCGTRNAAGERLIRVRPAPAKLTVAADGKALPIVYGKRLTDDLAAKYLRDCIREMTGIAPRLIPAAQAKDVKEAIFVIADNPPDSERFTTTVGGGAVRFTGAAHHAAYDFAERELGVRQYWPAKDGGRSVLPAKRIEVLEGSWSDAPFYKRRQNWPYDTTEWGATFKPGDSLCEPMYVHAPHKWWSETNHNYKVTRPDIFQLTRNGKRNPPMLCYGNPRTLETYKERIVGEIERGEPSGGLLSLRDKCITVSQWDGEVCCCCEHCKGLYDRTAGFAGEASPLIWGHFTAQLSDWLKAKYPDWKIVILPYINTCDVPKDFAFTNGNVVAMLCTMPGLAMLKQADAKAHEEALIRQWYAATGNKVIIWHYSCWPAESTAAPLLFGETASAHFRDCRDVIAGTFINGGWKPLGRQALSLYATMKVLWNPETDVQALYDEFAARMFGKAAKPMRELVRMQEKGWSRQWNVAKAANKNVYGISYPRHEVLIMQELLAEAKKLAAGDETVLGRIAYYEKECFERFFAESEAIASGTAFEPVKIQKIGSLLIIDGAVDEADWQKATPAKLYSAINKTYHEARYPTEVRMVWVPDEGVVFGFKCFDPDMAHARRGGVACLGNETVEMYLDPTGAGEGKYVQLLADIDGNTLFYTEEGRWQPEGVKAAVKTYGDRWEVEVFLPFAALGRFTNAQIPDAGAGGRFWVGNVTRQRYSNSTCNMETHMKDDRFEVTRLWTRWSYYNNDQSAFGEFKFEE